MAAPRVGVGVLLERRNAAGETEVLVGLRRALRSAPPRCTRRPRSAAGADDTL
jgi:hypothetical protein